MTEVPSLLLRCRQQDSVVITGPFIIFLLHNHFITKKIKKKSGDVNYEANFSFFILLHKRAKPILLIQEVYI